MKLQSFDPNTPIHDLAMTAGRTSITASSAANSPVAATVEAQKFVQIVGLVGSRVKIKTEAGIEGFADGRLLEPSKIVETLDLSFADGKLDSKSTKKLASLLQHVVPTDAAAQYSLNDKADGLAQAQSILSVVTKSRLDTTSAGSIYPKISSDQSIRSGVVRLTIAAFGLDKDGRGSPDAVSVSSPTVSVSLATAVQSESVNTPDCLTPKMSLDGSDKGTLAYIQYDGTKEQYTLSAEIPASLTASGFNKTSPEKVDTKSLPTVQGQIRRCPQFPATLANAAVSALQTCGLGEYKVITLPAAICQRVSTPSIEIWLARAPTN